MKTKTLFWAAIFCVLDLFSVNLVYGYRPVSPYAYCMNNPIKFVDPDGKAVDWYETLDDDLNKQIKYTELTSQQALDNAGINGRYLGQAVVIFDGSMDERLSCDSKLTGEEANPAKVTIYGVNGETDIETYNGLTVSSDPSRFPMLQDGEYIAHHEQMATSVYGKDSKTYKILDINGRDQLSPVGGYNQATHKNYMDGIFLHRTNWNGDASASSQGCLNIDGRQWKAVEKQLQNSMKIFIILKR